MDVGRQCRSQPLSRHVGAATLGLARQMGLGGGALAVSEKALLFGKRSKNFFLLAQFACNSTSYSRSLESILILLFQCLQHAAQSIIDARLPSWPQGTQSLQKILVQPERNQLFRKFQCGSTTLHHTARNTDLRGIKKRVRKLGCIVSINPICHASGVLPRHGKTSLK